MEDIPIIIKIALSTANRNRVSILKLLLTTKRRSDSGGEYEHKRQFFTRDLTESLNISKAGSSSSTAISSFFSFFSLVPLGCCGSWLIILSFLPSIFGSSLSVALIQYSKPLSYMGLLIVFGFAALSDFKLQRELKQMRRKSVLKVKEEGSGFGS